MNSNTAIQLSTMVQNQAPDGFPSNTDRRGDGEAEKGLGVGIPMRQEGHVGVDFSSSLGDTGIGSLLQGLGVGNQMLPTDLVSLFPHYCWQSGMISLVGNNRSVQQLELLRTLLTSSGLTSVDAFKSRIAVMGHPPVGVDRSMISQGILCPLSSIDSSRSSDSQSPLNLQTETAKKTFQKVDAGIFQSFKIPCRSRGMSTGHDFEVSKEQD